MTGDPQEAPDLVDARGETGMDIGPVGARKLLHRRRIAYDGFARADGLFDVEARLLDRRSHAMTFLIGPDRPAGAVLHHMGVRVTIDAALDVREVEPVIATGYVPECADIASAYRKLIGLNLAGGYAKAVRANFSSRCGCAHMTEMLLGLSTVAMQTVWAQQEVEWRKGGPTPDPHGRPHQEPAFADACHAFRRDGAVMRLHWPEFAAPQVENDA